MSAAGFKGAPETQGELKDDTNAALEENQLKAPNTYSVEQMDEVRDIWATYALQFKRQVLDDNVLSMLNA